MENEQHVKHLKDLRDNPEYQINNHLYQASLTKAIELLDEESSAIDKPVSADFDGEGGTMETAMDIIRKFRDKYNPNNAVMYISNEDTGEIIFYADKSESAKLLKIVSQNSR